MTLALYPVNILKKVVKLIFATRSSFATRSTRLPHRSHQLTPITRYCRVSLDFDFDFDFVTRDVNTTATRRDAL